MDRREREALDRHITGNYGEDQFRDEIVDGMLKWDPGALPTKTLDRILADVLTDIWEDCYRREDSIGRVNQCSLFREKLMAAILAATDQQMRVT